MLVRAKMQFVEGFSSPMNSGKTLTTFGSDVVVDPQLYRSIVRALQYVTITRPKISSLLIEYANICKKKKKKKKNP